MRERRGTGGDCVSSRSHSRVPLELKTGKMYRKQGTVEHRAQVSPPLRERAVGMCSVHCRESQVAFSEANLVITMYFILSIVDIVLCDAQ